MLKFLRKFHVRSSFSENLGLSKNFPTFKLPICNQFLKTLADCKLFYQVSQCIKHRTCYTFWFCEQNLNCLSKLNSLNEDPELRTLKFLTGSFIFYFFQKSGNQVDKAEKAGFVTDSAKFSWRLFLSGISGTIRQLLAFKFSKFEQFLFCSLLNSSFFFKPQSAENIKSFKVS